MKKVMVVVGGHPDDICMVGGIAAKYAKAGNKVVNLSLTLGESVRQPGPGQEKVKILRKAEGRAISKILGAEFMHLDIVSCTITPDFETKMKVVSALRELKADVLLFPTPWDVHADHHNLSYLMRDVVFLQGIVGIKTGPDRHSVGSAFMYDVEVAFNKLHDPDVIIDISDVADIKWKSVVTRERAKVFGELGNKSWLAMMKKQCAFWGMRIGREYAEPLFHAYGSMRSMCPSREMKVRENVPEYVPEFDR